MINNENAMLELGFKSVLDALPCYVLLVDRQFKIIYANKSLGDDFGDVTNTMCFSILKGLPEKCDACLVEQTFMDKQVHMGEGTLIMPSGQENQIIMLTTPVLGIMGDAMAVIKIAFSVNQIKNMHQELILLGQSVAFLSHDIKNILEGLQGGAYVVDEGLKDKDMSLAGKGWKIVKKNIFEISRITQNILFSSKKREPEYTHSNPGQIVREIVKLYRERADLMGIQLIHEVYPQMPRVKMDKISISRMLGNLVWNALEAFFKSTSDKTPTVTVRSGFYGVDQYMFEVEDNGRGMDFTVMDSLFKKFYSTKGNKGTGLGLVVVDRIVKQHDGKIDVLSKPGVGSLFRVVLEITS
ncbi:HAMP domain-containing sensor histidine kinase [Desulfobacterales bacterium HSG17]|nr:HAMP domain-containing sensor histidine kinase [Desulfobacterales bacterium HSG17]